MKNGSQALQRGSILVTEAGQGRISYERLTETATAHVFVNRTEEEWELPRTGAVLFGRGLHVLGKKVTLLPQGFCVLE
jgi:hypothetical protein